jgi:hypothetical protein
MTRFRQDNTQGYSDADLDEMNAVFDHIMTEDYPDSDEPDFNRKSFEDHVAEKIQFAFDQGARGASLFLV